MAHYPMSLTWDNRDTHRETHIIRLRYGLDGQQSLTQREIATLCGISCR